MSDETPADENQPRKKFEWRWNGGNNSPVKPPQEVETSQSAKVETAVSSVQVLQKPQQVVIPKKEAPKQAQVMTAKVAQKEETPEQESPKQRSDRILIGIPTFNIENSIASTIVQLQRLSKEILVCDDGSTDRTGEIAKALGCQVIRHPSHLGDSDSLRSLFLSATEKDPDVFLTIKSDIDSAYMKEDLPKLVNAVLKKECDIAIGSIAPKKVAPKKPGADLLEIDENQVLDSLGNPIRDTGSLVRAYSRSALAKISPPGSNDSVVYSAILNFVMEQGMRIYQFDRTSTPHDDSVSGQSLEDSKTKISATKNSSGLIGKLYHYIGVKHPITFFGIPSIAFLGASGYVAYTTAEIFLATQGLSIDRLVISIGSFLSALLLGGTAFVLYSIKKRGSEEK